MNKNILGGAMMGAPIAGWLNGAIAYGYYLQKWTDFSQVLPQDPLGWGLSALGLLSLAIGLRLTRVI